MRGHERNNQEDQETYGAKMKKSVYVLFATLPILMGCANRYKTTDFWSGEFSKDLGLKESVLSSADSLRYAEVLKASDNLIEYSVYLKKAQDEYRDNRKQWDNRGDATEIILTKEDEYTAHFGFSQNGKYSEQFAVTLGDISEKTIVDSKNADKLNQMSRCKSNAIRKIQSLKKPGDIKFQTVVISQENGYVVYSLPEIDNEQIAYYGGGIRLQCDNSGQLSDNIIAHQNVITADKYEASVRSKDGSIASYVTLHGTTFPTEMEIFQMKNYKDMFFSQYVFIKEANKVLSLWSGRNPEKYEFLLLDDLNGAH